MKSLPAFMTLVKSSVMSPLHLALKNDGYDGLNGRFNSLSNILLLKDDYSSFGSPFVDSIRTAVTEETTEALHIFYLRPSMDAAEALELTTACGNMFTSISGGDVKSSILHEGQTSITMN